jgi:hypothetical protein
MAIWVHAQVVGSKLEKVIILVKESKIFSIF